MQARQVSYWAIVGILLGAGLVLIFSVGLPIFALGIAFALYKIKAANIRDCWMALITLGITAAALLMYPYATSVHCSPTVQGPCSLFPTEYLYTVVFFVAVAVFGVFLELRSLRA